MMARTNRGKMLRTQTAVQILLEAAVRRDQEMLYPGTDAGTVDGTTMNQTLLFALIDTLGFYPSLELLDAKAKNDRERNLFRLELTNWRVFEAHRAAALASDETPEEIPQSVLDSGDTELLLREIDTRNLKESNMRRMIARGIISPDQFDRIRKENWDRARADASNKETIHEAHG